MEVSELRTSIPRVWISEVDSEGDVKARTWRIVAKGTSNVVWLTTVPSILNETSVLVIPNSSLRPDIVA